VLFELELGPQHLARLAGRGFDALALARIERLARAANNSGL
jgi:hypothetical protein